MSDMYDIDEVVLSDLYELKIQVQNRPKDEESKEVEVNQSGTRSLSSRDNQRSVCKNIPCNTSKIHRVVAPTLFDDAQRIEEWQDTIGKEIAALIKNET